MFGFSMLNKIQEFSYVETTDEKKPNVKLGSHLLIRQSTLGAGSYGKTVEFYDETLPGALAIKEEFLDKRTKEYSQGLEMERERQFWEILYGFGKLSGDPLAKDKPHRLLMPRLDGCHIQQFDFANQHEFLQAMIAIMKFVQFMHEKKIVHGDIQVGNLHIKKEEGKFTAKLFDFGFTRFIGEMGKKRSVSYCAPEVCRDAFPAHPSQDCFSLGCLIDNVLLDSFYLNLFKPSLAVGLERISRALRAKKIEERMNLNQAIMCLIELDVKYSSDKVVSTDMLDDFSRNLLHVEPKHFNFPEIIKALKTEDDLHHLCQGLLSSERGEEKIQVITWELVKHLMKKHRNRVSALRAADKFNNPRHPWFGYIISHFNDVQQDHLQDEIDSCCCNGTSKKELNALRKISEKDFYVNPNAQCNFRMFHCNALSSEASKEIADRAYKYARGMR